MSASETRWTSHASCNAPRARLCLVSSLKATNSSRNCNLFGTSFWIPNICPLMWQIFKSRLPSLQPTDWSIAQGAQYLWRPYRPSYTLSNPLLARAQAVQYLLNANQLNSFYLKSYIPSKMSRFMNIWGTLEHSNEIERRGRLETPDKFLWLPTFLANMSTAVADKFRTSPQLRHCCCMNECNWRNIRKVGCNIRHMTDVYDGTQSQKLPPLLLETTLKTIGIVHTLTGCLEQMRRFQ